VKHVLAIALAVLAYFVVFAPFLSTYLVITKDIGLIFLIFTLVVFFAALLCGAWVAWKARQVELATYLLAAACLLAYCIAISNYGLITPTLKLAVPFTVIRLLLRWARKRAG